eukprot:363280-Chlamydomonas_euryale.AAC.9
MHMFILHAPVSLRAPNASMSVSGHGPSLLGGLPASPTALLRLGASGCRSPRGLGAMASAACVACRPTLGAAG